MALHVTSWRERWDRLVGGLGAAASRRVERGRALTRRGAVEALTVTAGQVTARVVEDRTRPARVQVTVPVVPAAVWHEVADAVAGQLRTTAALLEGRVPDALGDELDRRGHPLIPELRDLQTTCGWREPDQPCRHVVATLEAVGLRIGREPSLLLTLRGTDPEAVLGQVRSKQLPDPARDDALDDLFRHDPTAPRGDLDAIVVHPAPPDHPAWLLEHLGPPPGIDDPAPLERLVARAAATAWRLAAGEGADTADIAALLAELRARRVATAPDLAAALGLDEDTVRASLDELFVEGVVLRTGQGERTRYRAAG